MVAEDILVTDYFLPRQTRKNKSEYEALPTGNMYFDHEE